METSETSASDMDVLTVGPGQQYATVADAVAAAQDGQTIEIQAGTYIDDFAAIDKPLVIKAMGGLVVEQATEPPPNGKAIWDVGGSGIAVTISGIEFTGAEVADANGAGIRYEGGTLTLNNDYFYANQEGLLAAPDPNGVITINGSEFANNGYGDGQTHNLYVNQIATLLVNGSYFHDAMVGHEIKSRALNTIVENSRVQDQNGTASYVIDLPNGGNGLIENNILEKGPNAENPIVISYGEEGNLNPGSLTVSDNVIVDELTSHIPVGVQNDTDTVALVTGNQVYGIAPAQLTAGPADVYGNTFPAIAPTLDTDPVDSAPCFLSGTRLATESGERAVEHLTVGDLVRARFAGATPVKWIGHRRIACWCHPHPELVWPVRVRAQAFGPDQPARDLFLSPDHSVSVPGTNDGPDVLIPIKHLVNGVTIVQEPVASVHYFHVELLRHDILLAEGLPTESYLDTGNRAQFTNGVEMSVRRADFATYTWNDACASLVTEGPAVLAVRRRLLARAAELGWMRSPTGQFHIAAAGKVVHPESSSCELYRYTIAPGVRHVRIISSTAVPAGVDPVSRDDRTLGARIDAVFVDGKVIALDSPALAAGFHAIERSGAELWRWTDGHAALILPDADRSRPAVLELLVRDVIAGWQQAALG